MRSGPVWPPALSDAQQLLLQTAWSAYSESGRWPVFDYLTAVAEAHGIDPQATLDSLPAVCPPNYGLIWHARNGPAQPDTEIVLTIAGMTLVDESDWLVTDYFRVLNAVASRWRALSYEPGKPRSLVLSYGDLVELIGPGPVEKHVVEGVKGALVHEPATWNGVNDSDMENWRWHVHSSIARFFETTSVDDYLRRVTAFLGPAQVTAPVVDLVGSTEHLVRDALSERTSSAWAAEDWDQVARQAVVFLEDRFRQLAKRPSAPGSADVVKAVLHPQTGTHPLAKSNPGECEGWLLLGLGLFKAVRNAVGHRLDSIQTRDEASAVVGLVRLILNRLEAEYPEISTSDLS